MQNVNLPNSSDASQPDDVYQADEQEAIVGWVRWWHWLIFVAVCLGAFLYYPVWRFDHRWRELQVGDSFERLKDLLGDPGKASYSVLGAGPAGDDEAFIYTRYWKTYEVLVSKGSRRVTAKSMLRSSTSNSAKSPAAAKKI